MDDAEPVEKWCNCGPCGKAIRSDEIGRRIAVGVRSVPLCAGCARRDDRWIVEAVEWGTDDVTLKG